MSVTEPRRFFYFAETIERPDLRTLTLVSIAFVSEDGERELYCVSTEFDPRQANDTAKAFVLPHLPWQARYPFEWEPVRPHADIRWMSERAIRDEVRRFLPDHSVELWSAGPASSLALSWLLGCHGYLRGSGVHTHDLWHACARLGVKAEDLPPPRPLDPPGHALYDARWVREVWWHLQRVESRRE